MSHIYSFERLDIWKLSIDLSFEIYKITESFLDNEKFGITNQLRRASNSISANITEGSSRTSIRDKSRFI